MDLSAAIKRVQPSIVQIRLRADDSSRGHTTPERIGLDRPVGTGFVVSLEGHVITANHVVEEGFKALRSTKSELKNLSVGFAYPNSQNMRGNFTLMNFDVVERDATHDMALLKLESTEIPRMFGNRPPVKLRPVVLKSDRPEDGVTIGISGYPLSQSVLVTNGGFLATSWAFGIQQSGLPGTPEFYRKLEVADSYLADINVNPGNSGGPVYLGSDGSVIGLCIAYLSTNIRDDKGDAIRNYLYNTGLAIVVPSRYVCDLLERHVES